MASGKPIPLAGQVLRLQWNAYNNAWGPMLEELRGAGLFLDLNLVTSDKKIVKAHKVVVSACSDFFRHVLSSMPGGAALFLRGVTSSLLIKLLDFMYHGDVNVEQEQLEDFLKLGEELRVAGLCEKDRAGGDKEENRKEEEVVPTLVERRRKTSNKENSMVNQLEDDWSESSAEQGEADLMVEELGKEGPPPQSGQWELEPDRQGNKSGSGEVGKKSKKVKKLRTLEELNDSSLNVEEVTMDLNEALEIINEIQNLKCIKENSPELDAFMDMVNSLIFKSSAGNGVLYFCAVCQKSLKMKQHMINHVEANHVRGVVHTCGECGAKMKTRSSLVVHRHKSHRQGEDLG